MAVPFAAVAKRPFPMRPTAPKNRCILPRQFFSTKVAIRLVEETEAHVVVGLLLLLGLLLGGSGLVGSTSGRGGTTSGGTSTTGRNGGELGGTLGDQLWMV
jgi:hypothetical protein